MNGPIVLRFCTASDITSRAIALWQKDGWATHVEAVLPDGTLLGAHLDGGVAIRPAGYDHSESRRELIVKLEGSEQFAQAFYEFLQSQVGKPYDLTAILGLLTGVDWRNEGQWFCSDLISAALERCQYFPRLATWTTHITPRDCLLLVSCRQYIQGAM